MKVWIVNYKRSFDSIKTEVFKYESEAYKKANEWNAKFWTHSTTVIESTFNEDH